ncbi:hypothetical protein Kpol_392p9 [Vanderwaltozyma polyspora DSM 70294]|uniref:Carbohydrate kinase FGGY C-terminal domain-containing protein n=1 Tax=Vanderwaltozyma polyspora (strain ATCC 22028 / DSM 70294 / BCRC 21397 / CBS 2163 / NBRC 10782 / NRRL Y-8283 / UCD 57-17) TaxID=436907 RepID=A7TRS0_VANPO|nr:uncharacterized protein Kpol_392p9 [Vanderwaltozyma polyspora DSM 70294]EDO15042.1 hypothetical protein Kpol_392p9 [Vanderwaltozyma polyspora DSM 70294]
MNHYIGVDVGTGSVRACVINDKGEILSLRSKDITKEELKPNYITQSSREIWQCICECVNYVLQESQIIPSSVLGIGFDATCSLVVIDKETQQEVGVGPNFEDDNRNIILWMDHRAVKETDEINATGDKCLKYVGGKMSVEMELPKIKWLKNNLADGVFSNCKFFDLVDYLTYKATDKDVRSFSSTVCKQGLLPLGVEGSDIGWSKEFFTKIDLDELSSDNFSAIGGSIHSEQLENNIRSVGEYVGHLSEISAKELGLPTTCIVGSGIIDAYAGWVGTVAAKVEEIGTINNDDDASSKLDSSIGNLAVIAGTSTCHITLSSKPIFVNGIWGPYRDVLSHNFWCAEGGQSCTGALLEHILTTHPAYPELHEQCEKHSVGSFEFLNNRLAELQKENSARSIISLGKHFFLYGDYHGNRSPISDESMRAAIIGQSMDTSIDSLAIMYLSACEFISQQSRQIISELVKAGHTIKKIYMSGGQARNQLLMRLLADCTGLPVVIPRYIDASVIFGSAILGAVAVDAYNIKHLDGNKNWDHGKTLWNKMCKLTPPGTVINPNAVNHPDRVLLNAKYKIFLDMAETQRKYRRQIDEIEASFNE